MPVDPYTARLKSLAGSDDPVSVLKETPSRLQRLLGHLPPEVGERRPQPGKWSISEILAHLADGELVFGHRLRMILGGSQAPLTAFDPDRWAEAFRYPACPLADSLTLFSTVRHANLALVERVPRERLALTGTHEEWGTESVAALLQIEAGHDRNHLAQIDRILAGAPPAP
jgi:hypothetical protein